MPTRFIDNIWLSDIEEGAYTFGSGGPFMTNLAKVNILVGPNNSGKSKFMRAVFHTNFMGLPDAQSPDSRTFEGNRQALNRFYALVGKALQVAGLQEHHKKCCPPPSPECFSHENLLNWLNATQEMLKQTGLWDFIPATQKQAVEDCQRLQDEALDSTRKSMQIDRVANDFEKVYIPTLRGLRNPHKLANDSSAQEENDLYRSRTIDDYFRGHEPAVFTGLSLYRETRSLLLDLRKSRDTVRRFESFLSGSFFDGQELSVIPKEDHDVLFVGLGQENEFPIYDLGDGLQQIIIMTFPVFVRDGRKVMLFIEEPELYLHPGMQRQLLQIFAATDGPFKDTQVFMTTHSNHFLDMTLEMEDVSVYRFTKELRDGEGESSIHFRIDYTTCDSRELLTDLGVRNSSVSLTNCTIWVEGITDRMYIRKFLELYQSSLPEDEARYGEDVHFTIAEYAGANIDHWFFGDTEPESEDEAETDGSPIKPIVARHLCGRALVIADKDGDDKAQRHKERVELLGDCYRPLQCVEIENLLSPDVVVGAIKSYRTCRDLQLNTPGSANDYSEKHLGAYIDNHILPENSPPTFADQSGTIKNKVGFARKACKLMTAPRHLSEPARALAEEIWGFIAKHNA